MTTKPAFPALGAPMSPAWVLPKSLNSGSFTLAKAVIRWMSDKITHVRLERVQLKWKSIPESFNLRFDFC